MIEYFVRHGCKRAIRNKPIRYGYKGWSQNTTNEYLIAFDVYQDKTYQGEGDEKKLGKVPASVMHLLGKYKNKKDYPYHVFIDNLFKTVPLLEVLDANRHHGTETVRVNRLSKSCPLADTADFKHTERGSMKSVPTIIASSLRNCCIRLVQSVGQWRGYPSFLSVWNRPTVKLKKVVENTQKCQYSNTRGCS